MLFFPIPLSWIWFFQFFRDAGLAMDLHAHMTKWICGFLIFKILAWDAAVAWMLYHLMEKAAARGE